MIYQHRFELTANQPESFNTTNLMASRNHFVQINDGSSVTVKASLGSDQPVIEIDTITGPGIFSLSISPEKFELLASSNTTVILSGN